MHGLYGLQVYKDEHIGFKSLDQGQWILANTDAKRLNQQQDELLVR